MASTPPPPIPPPKPTIQQTDYLVLGGGLVGTVLSSRLAQRLPVPTRVTLVEAGTDEHTNPLIRSPAHAHALRDSDHVWRDVSVPQRHLNDRAIPVATGRTLSGSSAVNAGAWTRCSTTDYDHWAHLIGDGDDRDGGRPRRWSYAGQLPYFKRAETWYNRQADSAQHGFDGPVRVHAAFETRRFPLRESVKAAFLKAGLGLKMNEDAQAGDPLGVSAWTENWHEGQRQPSGAVYGLEGVEVLTGCQASKILLDKAAAAGTGAGVGEGSALVARGVELVDGRVILAKKEVIVCCGAFRTPQLLMLSGIGPKKQLAVIDVPTVLDNEAVGMNLHDQISVSLFYKLKDGAAKGLALGSPHFNKPEYALGSPVDWLAISSIDPNVIQQGLQEDGEAAPANHSLLAPSRPHTEMVFVYGPVGAGLPGLSPPRDGTIITAAVLNLLPTSRGSIRLISPSVTTAPQIDPNYYATHTDRAILRASVRNLLEVLDSFEDGILDGELVIEPYGPLTRQSTDAEIDERVQASSSTWYHFAGTAAMGRVVDADLRVMGVRGLRVADASVLPCPLGGHYQAAMYALGEQAAEVIAKAFG